MAIKLHRCRIQWFKGPHPCWRAQKALDDAGIEYQLVPHAALHKGRPEIEELSGKRWLPLIEFEDGTLLRESKAIVAAARDGTLKQTRIAPGSNSA